MQWHDLLFAHWPLPPDCLRPLIPRGLELDTFDGRAWIGVVPFRMTGVRPRGFPKRWAMAFPEINVRTYVSHSGRPGVWFFSLDCTHRLAVRAARIGYRLPYYHAAMQVEPRGSGVSYRSRRAGHKASPVEFEAFYRPVGAPFTAEPGALTHWLTERYRLYTHDGKRVCFAEIHHPPWLLQDAEAQVFRNTMPSPLGLRPGPAHPPLLHFARHQDVLAWPLTRAGIAK